LAVGSKVIGLVVGGFVGGGINFFLITTKKAQLTWEIDHEANKKHKRIAISGFH
jgi:Na+/glutamate symporter